MPQHMFLWKFYKLHLNYIERVPMSSVVIPNSSVYELAFSCLSVSLSQVYLIKIKGSHNLFYTRQLFLYFFN